MDNHDVQYPVLPAQLRLPVTKGVARYQYIYLPVCRVSPISWHNRKRKNPLKYAGFV
jgi:hypothetical protein